MKNNISVIIPNQGSDLSNDFLTELLKIDCEEIIFVGGILNLNIVDPRIKILENISKSNASINRNIGSEKTKSDFLLFVDKDVILDSSYINNNFVNKQIDFDLIYGMYKSLKFSKNFFDYFHNEITVTRSLNSKIFSSSHFLINRKIFNDIGKFNTVMDSYEDIEFFNRVLKSENIKIFFDENFKGLHIKKYNIFNSIKETFIRFKNSIYYKNKYKKIFVKETMDKTIKEFFFSKFATLLLIFIIIFYKLNLVIFSSVFILLLFYEKLVQKKIFNSNNIITFIYCYIYSIILSLNLGIALLYSLANLYVKKFIDTFKRARDLGQILIKIYLKRFGPIQIIHYVTARCNLRCEHCFYKETLDKKDPGEQDLLTMNKATKNMGPILWYALAGGEVFIRKDVPKIIDVIKKNTNVKYLSIPSNGWYTERMYNSVLEILRKHPELLFSIYFSVDGFPDIHDEIRGNNSFQKLRESYEKLSHLKKFYPNFKTNIVTTITEQNCTNSSELIKYLFDEFEPDNISINLFRYHSLVHPKIPDKIIKGYDNAFNTYFEIKEKMKNKSIFKDLISKIFIVKDMIQKYIIVNVAQHNKFVTPCTAGRLSYVIMEDGKVKPCEILDESYGNIFQSDFSNIIKSNNANLSRKNIIKSKCMCTYECAMSTNALFSWPMTKKFILRFFRFSFR
tara:strand:- start:8428 stop:10461 length:2034 start_codon:yes stop_codon:yes gene_type:complete